MREILFRAKRRVDYGDPTEWQFGVPFKDGDGDWIMKDSCVERVIQNDTLGQFTGLTDKNGVKIFEGDIIEYESKRYSINYLSHYARFAAVKPNTVFTVFAYQRGKVIGNIYDNPELLREDGE